MVRRCHISCRVESANAMGEIIACSAFTSLNKKKTFSIYFMAAAYNAETKDARMYAEFERVSNKWVIYHQLQTMGASSVVIDSFSSRDWKMASEAAFNSVIECGAKPGYSLQERGDEQCRARRRCNNNNNGGGGAFAASSKNPGSGNSCSSSSSSGGDITVSSGNSSGGSDDDEDDCERVVVQMVMMGSTAEEAAAAVVEPPAFLSSSNNNDGIGGSSSSSVSSSPLCREGEGRRRSSSSRRISPDDNAQSSPHPPPMPPYLLQFTSHVISSSVSSSISAAFSHYSKDSSAAIQREVSRADEAIRRAVRAESELQRHVTENAAALKRMEDELLELRQFKEKLALMEGELKEEKEKRENNLNSYAMHLMSLSQAKDIQYEKKIQEHRLQLEEIETTHSQELLRKDREFAAAKAEWERKALDELRSLLQMQAREEEFDDERALGADAEQEEERSSKGEMMSVLGDKLRDMGLALEEKDRVINSLRVVISKVVGWKNATTTTSTTTTAVEQEENLAVVGEDDDDEVMK